jgi:hypothetical protein
VGTAIPSVRDEISTMREEMERLRSFVGDLARGSRQADDASAEQDGHDQETQVATAASPLDSEREGGVGPGTVSTGETSLRQSVEDLDVDADASFPRALLEVSSQPLLHTWTTKITR